MIGLGCAVRRSARLRSIRLNSDGSYTTAGDVTGAAVAFVGPHFTLALPTGIISASVILAGAQGGNRSSAIGGPFVGGKGGLVNAAITFASATSFTVKVGKQAIDGNGSAGGYGGGNGGSGDGGYPSRGGGGSTSIASSSIIAEAGGGAGAFAGNGVDGGYEGTETGGNASGAALSATGGGWNAGTTESKGGKSKIVSPATGTYTAGGNSGDGYLIIQW